MDKNKAKQKALKSRHERIRKKISGTAQRPRLCVFRSLKHIYAQIIDDTAGTTLVSVSSMSSSFKEKHNRGNNIAAAKVLGELISDMAKDKGINQVVYDRGGYAYHGRIKALAEVAREKGIKF